MAYTKNTWASGDVVTSAKLNNIENGIASGGVLYVDATVSGSTITLTKTWNEINNAALPIMKYTNDSRTYNYVMPVSIYSDDEDEEYSVTFKLGNSNTVFTCLNADDYPSCDVD